jgi:hypothetical protein
VRRLLLIATAAALVAAPVSLGLDRGQTRALARVAVQLSGLSERRPLRVVAVPAQAFEQRRAAALDRAAPRAARAHDERVLHALGLAGELRRAYLVVHADNGFYDPRTRTGYVRAGAGERAAGLRVAVRALEDQHFGLGRLARMPSRDARLAATAAFDGYAELVTRGVVGRHSAPTTRSRLGRFVALERDLGASAGARFIGGLRHLGGPAVALGGVRRLPATTEQVLHLDKYLEREPAARVALPPAAVGLRLREAGTFGELDVRALLGAFAVPRRDRAAAGWGGGRTARYTGPAGEAIAVVLTWDTALDAAQWDAAAAQYLRAAFGGSATGVAFTRSGRRTSLVVGPDAPRAEALARALTGQSRAVSTSGGA